MESCATLLQTGGRMRHRSVPPWGDGRWRDFPALLASGGVWLNSASPQTTPALIRPPLCCSAPPKGGTGRCLMLAGERHVGHWPQTLPKNARVNRRLPAKLVDVLLKQFGHSCVSSSYASCLSVFPQCLMRLVLRQDSLQRFQQEQRCKPRQDQP